VADDVATLLAEALRDGARVEITGRATVGLSQATWFVRVAAGGEERDAVPRLPTPASGPRAILTQRAALQAVADRVPAPAVLWHDNSDASPFGRPCIVMERIDGDVTVGWHEVPEPARGAFAEQAIDAMAALHAVDPAPLEGGGPGPTTLAFYRRRLERYAPLPGVLRGAVWWLERHEPPPTPRWALVHGDFRMGNMIVERDRLRGVLDWEMAAPSDPIADLARCFIPLWELPELDEAPLLRRYGQRMGIEVDPQHFRWHRVLGYVRLAYHALTGTSAFDSGRSDDFRLAALRLQLPVHLARLAHTLAGDPVT
jgi:aminoglycoside phosphotransferase (APT) family kinase protein